MPSITPVDYLPDQLAAALKLVRKHRHFDGCRCGHYRGLWCTGEESTACMILDRLIDRTRLPTAQR